MSLKLYQKTISASTLYETEKLGGVSGLGAQIQPNIEIIGANADIYFSQTKPIVAPTGMTKLFSAVTGIQVFTVIPTYMYIDSAATSLVLTGISANPA